MSAFDLSKLNSSLYDMKLARGTDEYLARFVGWESQKTQSSNGESQDQDLALFAVRTDQGEELRKLVFLRDRKVNDEHRLKMLFALVFASRSSQVEEWVPSQQELEMVK